MSERHSEAAFETVIEAHLLANGYVTMNRDGFDRERAIFSETVLAFIRTTQPKEWVNLDARDRTHHCPAQGASYFAYSCCGDRQNYHTREHGRYFARAMWR